MGWDEMGGSKMWELMLKMLSMWLHRGSLDSDGRIIDAQGCRRRWEEIGSDGDIIFQYVDR